MIATERTPHANVLIGIRLALLPVASSPFDDVQRRRRRMENQGTVRVQFLPVGRNRREWMWTARDESSNTITISGQRFDSLGKAVRDARSQLDDANGYDGTDGGPWAA